MQKAQKTNAAERLASFINPMTVRPIPTLMVTHAQTVTTMYAAPSFARSGRKVPKENACANTTWACNQNHRLAEPGMEGNPSRTMPQKVNITKPTVRTVSTCINIMMHLIHAASSASTPLSLATSNLGSRNGFKLTCKTSCMTSTT